MINWEGDLKMDKRANKKTGEELQMYFHFKRRGGKSKLKKGKGSYSRKEFKSFKDDYSIDLE